MNDHSERDSLPRGKGGIWLGFLVIVGIVIGGIWVHRRFCQREVNLKLEAIRKAGYPASLADIPSWQVPVSYESNAASVVLEAIKYIPSNTLYQVEWPARKEPLSELSRDILIDYLADGTKALELAHHATQFEVGIYPVKYSSGFEALLPHLAHVKSLSNLLRWQSLMDTENNDVNGALQRFEDGLAVARSLENEPILISQLVRLACIQITCGGLERLLNQRALSEPQIAKAMAALVKAEQGGRETMARALISERCFGIHGFSLPLSKIVDIDSASFSEDSFLSNAAGDQARGALKLIALGTRNVTGLKEMDLLAYLEAMDLRIDAAKRDFPEALDLSAKATKIFNADISKHRLDRILTRMLVPSLDAAIEKAANGAARLRLCEAALALEQYRMRHDHQAPDKLESLVPDILAAVPEDPFDGKPLRYLRLEKGYRVYSVGKDRIDDGGDEPPMPTRNEKGRITSKASPAKDVTFTVEREP